MTTTACRAHSIESARVAQTKKQDLIRRSVELVGMAQLAERIDSPRPLIEAWMKLAGVLTELANQR
jgi:hypothetical protein